MTSTKRLPTNDRIIITTAALEDYIPDSAQVCLFDQLFELDFKPKKVSDHYPVFAEFHIEMDSD